MAFISINQKNIITAVSDKSFQTAEGCRIMEISDSLNAKALLGRMVARRAQMNRLAVIANWKQCCGISTYTGYLVNELRKLFPEVRIFSEEGCEETDDVIPCWKRGQSMHNAVKQVQEWEPDFVLVQHEFGLFPKAPFLLQMLQMLDSLPYAVVLHSTYEHLDKTICTSAMKQIIVHTDVAKNVLRSLGNTNRIDVIPHGCVTFTNEERKELWNIFQTDYAIIQFGFGFFYKGVDRAIDAVHLLKTQYPEKYKDIFYLYLCSENGHTKNIHNDYMDYLIKKVEDLGLHDNVAIIKKYHSDQEINNYLRTAKLALFPYINNPNNTVYGASGAIRVSMANGIPVIASESHLFDELPVPRPENSEDLAKEIHKIFSDWKYKKKLIDNQDHYVYKNSWSEVAKMYRETMEEIRKERHLVL